MPVLTKESAARAHEALKPHFGYTNTMQTPRLVKVVVSTGIGKISDKHKRELIEDRIAKITGQKPAKRGAKKSIATFKLREGDVIGLQATLRGARMYDFIDKLVHIALPRMRDFRGLSTRSIDEIGNLTIGLREHTIFPETSDEELRDVFGFAITVVTTAKNKKEAEAFFRHLGFPFSQTRA
jgi:large subunit ribosomal protein L5